MLQTAPDQTAYSRNLVSSGATVASYMYVERTIIRLMQSWENVIPEKFHKMAAASEFDLL